MAQYNFDQNDLEATFKGSEFFTMRGNDLFLSDLTVVEGILCQGKKIRQQLKVLQPGQTLTIGTAQISQGRPLIIKKGGPNIQIRDDEYTLNRLTGICAAYAAQQGSSFSPRCAMAIALGLEVARDRILYYSAAPGSEHFTEVFTYHPLLCAVRQLELGKVSKENISRIAAVKNASGKTLATLLTEAKTSLPSKLTKFGTGGSRGVVELDKALSVIRSLSGAGAQSTSR